MPAAAIYSAGIVLLPPYIVPVATIYSAGIVLLPHIIPALQRDHYSSTIPKY